ncbi:hypothetical protein Tco_1323004, partial [Tanacetum coccineum]
MLLKSRLNDLDIAIVFSNWMTFEGNTRDLGSFGEETDKTTDLHQISWKNYASSAWRRRLNLLETASALSRDGVREIKTASERGLPSLKLSLHSCSLSGSTNAMGIETSIAFVLPAKEHESVGESVAAPEICCRRQKHRYGAQKDAATGAEHLVLP